MNFGNFFENFSFSTTFQSPSVGATAFFDSGIGGLTVLRACLYEGLSGDILYYGDNARAPYGQKDVDSIKRYTQEAFSLFEEYGVGRAIIACNTVTALLLDECNACYPFPVHGTFPPLLSVREKKGEIFAFVTTATAKSLTFKYTCAQAREKGLNLKVYPLDGLVGEIERNVASPRGIAYTDYLPKGNPAAVVLGCTHYSFLKEEIACFYRCPVYDSSEETAKRLKKDGVIGVSKENTEKSPFLYPSYLKKRVNISFVGSGKVVNKTTCEQMFALK